ncbi:MAG TPA: hypothetical protein VN822_04295 [Candidatus Acidoferrales bacterium]|nr:hypothetical protein [Candidatus Acidoferrales bacterium]
MKSTEIFDVCHARYRGLREWLKDTTGAVRSLDLGMPSPGYLWRPERARACEYLADFERIGRRALRRPEWKGRLKLFNVYFVRGAEYRRAIRLVGVAEGTFDYWYAEVKRALGSEFSRTGLYPPSRYFQMRSAEPGNRWRPSEVNEQSRSFGTKDDRQLRCP